MFAIILWSLNCWLYIQLYPLCIPNVSQHTQLYHYCNFPFFRAISRCHNHRNHRMFHLHRDIHRCHQWRCLQILPTSNRKNLDVAEAHPKKKVKLWISIDKWKYITYIKYIKYRYVKMRVGKSESEEKLSQSCGFFACKNCCNHWRISWKHVTFPLSFLPMSLRLASKSPSSHHLPSPSTIFHFRILRSK